MNSETSKMLDISQNKNEGKNIAIKTSIDYHLATLEFCRLMFYY